MAKTKLETLSIDLLRLDGGTQARIKINEDTVDDYADVLTEAGGDWPFDPNDVFHDGSDYFVADGFHRTLAAIRVKRASIPCRVHQGTSKDAKIFGMTANDTHGLRMSREDKRACVEWLLDNGGKMTQAEIAVKAGVSVRTVQYVVSSRNPQIAGSTVSAKKSTKAPILTDAEKLKKKKEKEAEKAKKKAEADAAKAKKKAEADAARAEKKKQAEAEKVKKREEAAQAKAAAKEQAKAAKEAADRETRSADEQAKLDSSVVRQLIEKAVRSVDDLYRTKQSPALGAKDRKSIDDCVKEITGPSISRRLTMIRLLQLAERLLWQ